MQILERCLVLLLCAIVLSVSPKADATAQTMRSSGNYSAMTGDETIDRVLPDINRYAARYADSFLDELVRYGEMPRDYAHALMQTHDWPAADVYFAAMLARVLDISFRDIVRDRSQYSDETWQDSIDRLAGEDDKQRVYREINERITRSYRHWARPLPSP